LGPSRRGSGKGEGPQNSGLSGKPGQTSDPGDPRTWGMQADQRMCSTIGWIQRIATAWGLFTAGAAATEREYPDVGVARECDGWALVIGIDVQCQPLAACVLRGGHLFQGIKSFGVSNSAFALVSTLAN
jgi:hypothetical protein